MPSMSNIEARHQEKTNKYSHFLTDITTYKTSLNCFEVTSTGFVSSRNVKTLRLLHKLMRKDLKRSIEEGKTCRPRSKGKGKQQEKGSKKAGKGGMEKVQRQE